MNRCSESYRARYAELLLVPEPESSKTKGNLPIEQGRGRLKMTKPGARLRGGGSMADIVRENRR